MNSSGKTEEGKKFPSCFHQMSDFSTIPCALVMFEEKYLVVHQQSQTLYCLMWLACYW